ncbi:hypothetical protein ATY77_08405 [Rhizobium sp. R634]|nr:hypothetical protein ATY77_07155 [Rhizobium sp. R634]OWV73236.1 hypothetical protein ATY77_08405 [Rhizobium sp. R634]
MLLLQLAQMLVVPFVRQIDQPFVEEFLAHTALRTSAEDDRLSLRIEGKGEPPLYLQDLDAKLFHVRVSGAFEGVDLRSSQSKSFLAKQHQMREQFDPDIGWEVCDLAFEAIMKLDLPLRHFIS